MLAHPDLVAPGAATTTSARALVDAVASRDAHGGAYPVADPRLLAAFAHWVALPDRASQRSTADAAAQMAADLVAAVRAVVDLIGTLASDAWPAAGPGRWRPRRSTSRTVAPAG
ncbi:hypothetical protein I6A60_05980 [Frankia sp. AgB1.9]|uniref:hypothetical protein n=1 Tax=unclassified Frankia TaxID=2632575 RepID=UPI0019320F14|nr:MULTISPECIES: hypothetical protein [unclassified Frankia]MBL7487467.1 hypothetical protein [Frankia sp. AgW1.1]MBL7547429.1 hypothetical protein [Frankia sp. AgB1.9]MBL7618796.1 hypothetical protein [Frankia sp. AgB1.8]